MWAGNLKDYFTLFLQGCRIHGLEIPTSQKYSRDLQGSGYLIKVQQLKNNTFFHAFLLDSVNNENNEQLKRLQVNQGNKKCSHIARDKVKIGTYLWQQEGPSSESQVLYWKGITSLRKNPFPSYVGKDMSK